jgi:DNA-binding NtrC family response regulator
MAIPLSGDRGVNVGRTELRAHGLVDGEISSKHVRLEQRSGTWHLLDLGSRNGTYLDGERLGREEEASLVDGAIIRLGRTVFVFREALPGAIVPSPPLGGLIGPFGLRGVAHALETLAARKPRVLLLDGETGTGKELLAQHAALHMDRGTPYVAVNVAGIAEGVFEAQLFGHVAGAYSDARTSSPGILVAHEGGTVFLDELGSLSLTLQAKLLRLLDQGEILAVGATAPRTVDVTLVAATNESLEDAVAAGAFRDDLLARLALARIELPPLRERAEDLPALARHLAKRAGLDLGPEHVEIEALERLMLHAWPRNVRELDAVLRKAASLDPRPGLRLWCVNRLLGPTAPKRAGLLSAATIEAALSETGGNETQAARRLGVSRGKLRRFLAQKDVT